MMKTNFNCYFKDTFYKKYNKYQTTAITLHFLASYIFLDFTWDIMQTCHFDWIFPDFGQNS